MVDMAWLFVLLLLISILGYYSFSKLYISVGTAQFPLLFIAFSVAFIYSFGIIGLLEIGYYLFLLCGCILLLISVYKLHTKNKTDTMMLLSSFVSSPFIFMLIGLIWLFVITRNANPSHPDDFSHWLKICKVMYYDNSFPVTPEITYLNYPPGTAVWIYIVTRTIGFSSGNCYFAQSSINLAACCFLFVIQTNINIKLRAIERLVLGLSIWVFWAVSNAVITRVFALTVDGALGLVTLATIIFIISMRENVTDYISLILLLVFLVLIKVAGILFVIFAISLYLSLKKQRGNVFNNGGIKTVILSVVPLLFFIAYIVRSKLLYDNVDVSDQAFSVQRFLSLSQVKDQHLIVSVIKNCIYNSIKLFGPGTSRIKLIWVSFAGLLSLYYFYDRKTAKSNKNPGSLFLLRYVFVCYWIFVLFLIFTYIFSMENYEAEVLGSYYRYVSILSIIVFGVFTYRFLLIMLDLNIRWPVLYLILYALIVLLLGFPELNYTFLITSEGYSYYNDLAWRRLSEVAEENNYYTEESYLVVWDASLFEDLSINSAYFKDVAETYFRSVNVEIIVTDLSSDYQENDCNGYDKVILVN